MAKLTRKNMLVFGGSSGVNQIEQFGSLAAGSPVYTTDPETIQALSNYLTGWFAGVVGNNSPAIEDMNALCYLYAYQLTYLFQTGVAEWNATAIYYIGSIVNNGLGVLYVSLTDGNVNHAVTDTANWKPFTSSSNLVAITTASSPRVLTAADAGKTFLVDTTTGAFQFTLAAAAIAANFTFKVKDAAGTFATNACTLARFGSEKIELLSSNYVMSAAGGEWQFSANGTDVFITGR